MRSRSTSPRTTRSRWRKYQASLPVLRLIRRISSETQMLLEEHEAWNLVTAVQATAKLPGQLAEFGVFRGGSARLLSAFKGKKKLHLFDSFQGLPEQGHEDVGNLKRGLFTASEDDVRAYLKDCDGLVFHPGHFPDSAQGVEERFSFVHLDVDLYAGTLAGLEYFYPRLVTGGILISHDFITFPGVKQAFDEYFADKPVPVFELYFPLPEGRGRGSQAMVVKTA